MNRGKPAYCYIVRTESKRSREVLISFLESEGYKSKEDEISSRQSILDSIFPIIVYKDNAIYDLLHTITCAAAAVSSQVVICEDEFYVLFKGPNATYDEYLAAVKRLFLESDYTVYEREEFFNRSDILIKLHRNYEGFLIGIAGCEPRATACSLDKMYE